jgi:PAS domain S-box-containing protein
MIYHESSEKTLNITRKYLGNPHLWVVAIMIVLLTIIHYHELFAGYWILERIGSLLGFDLSRHTWERILFIFPVVYGTIKLGTGAGISLVVLVSAAMLPRIFLISTDPREAAFETGGVFFVCVLLVALHYLWQKGSQRLVTLEATQRQLNSHVQRLSMLHTISTLVNQPLELNQTMKTVIVKVAQIMDSSAAWLYLWNEETSSLKLVVSTGISPEATIGPEKSNPCPNCKAFLQKTPVIVENSNSKSLSASELMENPDLKSLLVVPLISNGIAIGTLGVGSSRLHGYPADEIDLFNAIAGQFSIAIENARLYQKERTAAEALRVSEMNYRDIFESASDPIWTHDLNSKILAVNNALCRLTGYEAAALIGSDVAALFPDHGLAPASKETHARVLKGESAPTYEHRLLKKDGSEVILQIGTSLITRAGEPWAFQHIARDITQERRIQENLRVYAQRVSQAQEAERKRIARELHDDTAQELVVISRHLGDIAAGKTDLTAKDVREEVRKVLEGVRNFSQELRPSILDDLGLISALKWLASDLTKNYGINVAAEFKGESRQLPPESELALFRITQEALTNIRKHSQASQVSIRMEFSQRCIRLTIQDNGKGFAMPSVVGDLARFGKLGLAGMQERAQLLGGTLNINSEVGKGTVLTIEAPG